MGVIGSAGNWVWNNREWLAKKLANLYAWFRGRADGRGILILGPGGVGKTTFARLLSGVVDLNDFLAGDLAGEYEESLRVERYRYKADGGQEIEVVVPPGQERHREATWKGLLSDVAGGRFRGAVVLGAYGYHDWERSWKEHRLYEEQTLPDEAAFLSAFAVEKREDEIAVLLRLGEAMKLNRERFWLLTLITKQDLWWKERDAAERHYREGRYGQALGEVMGQQDAARVRNELAFASLVINSLFSGRGELLRPNTEGYDQRRQAESLRRLFEALGALQEWETIA